MDMFVNVGRVSCHKALIIFNAGLSPDLIIFGIIINWPFKNLFLGLTLITLSHSSEDKLPVLIRSASESIALAHNLDGFSGKK